MRGEARTHCENPCVIVQSRAHPPFGVTTSQAQCDPRQSPEVILCTHKPTTFPKSCMDTHTFVVLAAGFTCPSAKAANSTPNKTTNHPKPRIPPGDRVFSLVPFTRGWVLVMADPPPPPPPAGPPSGRNTAFQSGPTRSRPKASPRGEVGEGRIPAGADRAAGAAGGGGGSSSRGRRDGDEEEEGSTVSRCELPLPLPPIVPRATAPTSFSVSHMTLMHPSHVLRSGKPSKEKRFGRQAVVHVLHKQSGSDHPEIIHNHTSLAAMVAACFSSGMRHRLFGAESAPSPSTTCMPWPRRRFVAPISPAPTNITLPSPPPLPQATSCKCEEQRHQSSSSSRSLSPFAKQNGLSANS